jgi:exonuclease SbcC
MRPRSLRLKGFLGIKAGLGVDDITLDLSNLPAGIVVLSGPNGSGKSTIIDSLTPYRLMPYRAGATYSPAAFSYYEQCYGDALKDFEFEIEGQLYRSLIVIDVDARKQEAYLYRKDSEDWVAMPGIDGKLNSYDRAVEDLVGSPQLFFTSIFRCQNARALADYGKGDIKALFVELLNIDHLKLISEKARRIKQELAGRAETLLFERKRLSDSIGTKPEKVKEVDESKETIALAVQRIDTLTAEAAVIQDEINECDATLIVYLKAQQEQAALKKLAQGKLDKANEVRQQRDRRIREYKGKELALVDKREKANALVAALPGLRKKMEERSELEETARHQREIIEEIEDRHNALLADLSLLTTHQTTIAEKEKALQGIRMKRDFAIKQAERNLEEAKKSAARLDTVPCSLDMAQQCRFVADAVKAREAIPELKESLASAQTTDSGDSVLISEIEELRTLLSDQEPVRADVARVKNQLNDARINLRRIDASAMALAQSADALARAELAEVSLPDIAQQLADLAAEKEAALAGLTTQIMDIESEASDMLARANSLPSNQDAKRRRTALAADLERIQKEIEATALHERRARETLGAAQEAVRQVEKAEDQLSTVMASITYLNNEISQYATLEKAFGDNGIVALTIDDAGPQISSLANQLLQVFGGRFTVRIDTQASKANGKGEKEVFQITIIDGETNETKNILKLSGGERVWCEAALTKAICLYNSLSSGRRFDTLFVDEADGPLDSQKKVEFWQMKKKVLELGGYRSEITITQTPGLMSLADAVMEFKKGEGVIVRAN